MSSYFAQMEMTNLANRATSYQKQRAEDLIEECEILINKIKNTRTRLAVDILINDFEKYIQSI